MGTWIEIQRGFRAYQTVRVVPLVGTWIEISDIPSYQTLRQVVPLVGTWIEIKTGSHFDFVK